MAVYEIDFKLQHDCPYNNLSRKYPNVLFSQWCNYSMEIREVSFKELNELSEFQAVQEDIQQYLTKLGAKIARKSFRGSNTQIIVHECICDTLYKSVTSVLEKHNCLDLQPTTYHAGRECYRIYSFSHSEIQAA